MFVGLKVTFLEREFLGEGIVAAKVELNEVQEVEDLTQSTDHTKSDLIRSNPEPNIEAPLRRSGRVPYQVDRYYDFLVHDVNPIEPNKNNEDPITYMDAMQRSNSEL